MNIYFKRNITCFLMALLASVSAPKLFALDAMATARASEVGAAAEEFIKMHDAFIVENGDSSGSWEMIGYVAPGKKIDKRTYKSKNFTYSDLSEKNIYRLSEKREYVVWRAISNISLGSCPEGSAWRILTEFHGEEEGASYELLPPNNPDCMELVPLFMRGQEEVVE